MATTARRKEDIAFREEYILELIKSSEKGVKGREIDEDCNISSKVRYKVMRKLMAENPEIVRTGGHRTPTYIWKEFPKNEPVLPAPKVISGSLGNPSSTSLRYPFVDTVAVQPLTGIKSPFLKNRAEKAMRNSEGYSDPTAGKAIMSVAKAEQKEVPSAGEVWSTTESNGTIGYIYVIAPVTGGVQCIRLFGTDESNAPEMISKSVEIDIHKRHMIGDCERVTFKVTKYLKNRVKFSDPVFFDKVRKDVCGVLKIQEKVTDIKVVKAEPEIREVVPEGYISKEEALKMQKEVVKEVVPDGYISPEEALKMQLDIWKEVAMRLLKKGEILCK